MKLYMFAAVMAFSASAFAGTQICTYELNKEGATLSWTAFKTPKKVGVKGKLTDFKVAAQKSATIDSLVASAMVDVNSQSVDTGDKARDAKIMTFFFKKMLKGTSITGKVLKVDQGKAQVEFTMNGVTKAVEMISKYDQKAGTLTLTGKMDVLEFGMKPNLEAITKACFEKHEGVTWPDVELEFIAKVTSSCK